MVRCFFQELHPIEIATVVEDEILLLQFEKALPLGEGTIRIGFSGIFNDHMKGFYRR